MSDTTPIDRSEIVFALDDIQTITDEFNDDISEDGSTMASDIADACDRVREACGLGVRGAGAALREEAQERTR